MKRLVSAFLAGAMALSLAACGGSASTSTAASSAAASAAPASSAAADSDLAYIQSNGKMVIGYTVYEPMNYTDADGNFTSVMTSLPIGGRMRLTTCRSVTLKKIWLLVMPST